MQQDDRRASISGALDVNRAGPDGYAEVVGAHESLERVAKGNRVSNPSVTWPNSWGTGVPRPSSRRPLVGTFM